MAGSILRFLSTMTVLLLLPASGTAAPKTGTSSPGTGREGTGRQRKVEEMKTLGVDRQLAASAVTEPNGFYDLRADYDPSDDVTVLLWFVAQDRSIMPKELVIQESKASRANGLISRCVPRASLTPGHQFRVYLFDHASRNKELAESDCLP